MTVTSANYSSLEEVWGESFNSSRPKKEKRKKIPDPICELYEMGNNNGYTDNDLVSYANSYFEKYDKSRSAKGMNEDDDVLPHRPRERPVRQVEITSNKRDYDVTDEDDVEETKPIPSYSAPIPRKESLPAPRPMKRHTVVEDDDDNSLHSGFAFIDLLLYIVSGIILIFVMEQFVKIGLLLQ